MSSESVIKSLRDIIEQNRSSSSGETRMSDPTTFTCGCPDPCFVHRPGLPFPDDVPWTRGFVGQDQYNNTDWIRVTFPKPSDEQLEALAAAFSEAWLDGTADFLRGLVADG